MCLTDEQADIATADQQCTQDLSQPITIDPLDVITRLMKDDHMVSKVANQLIDVLQTAVKLRVYNQRDLKETGKIPQSKHTDQVKVMSDSATSNQSNCSIDKVMSDSSTSNQSNCNVHEACLVHAANKLEITSELTQIKQSNIENQSLDTASNTDPCESVGARLSACAPENNAKIAVLFSGGVDSTVIAALVDK